MDHALHGLKVHGSKKVKQDDVLKKMFKAIDDLKKKKLAAKPPVDHT